MVGRDVLKQTTIWQKWLGNDQQFAIFLLLFSGYFLILIQYSSRTSSSISTGTRSPYSLS